MRLNLGAGSDRLDGYVNVDVADIPGVDVVHDLDVTPWPFDDHSVKGIVAKDVFEHVGDPIGFMTEAHRVLESGGQLALKVPHFRHQDAFTDPTHRRFCTEHTFDYWIRGTVLYSLHNAAYSRGGHCEFYLEGRSVQAGAIHVLLRKI